MPEDKIGCTTCQYSSSTSYSEPCRQCCKIVQETGDEFSKWVQGSVEPEDKIGCTTCRHGRKATYETPCHHCLQEAARPGNHKFTKWQRRLSLKKINEAVRESQIDLIMSRVNLVAAKPGSYYYNQAREGIESLNDHQLNALYTLTRG